jgi:hypothetical protein
VNWIRPFIRRWPRAWYGAAYGLAVGLFLWCAAQFHVPGKGFTSLILFGGDPPRHRISELTTVDYYVYEDSRGYDGQYYAQMAMQPRLGSLDLRAALDNLPYRARRMLFCWTAFGLGLGQPRWVLEAYALQNVVVWLVLAWLLLRWFPPTDLNNLVRWVGTMFAWGLALSVREALMDGPSLLLIAGGVALAEQGRRWTSACVLGVAGMGRETNLLAGVICFPQDFRDRRETLRAVGRGLVAVAPLSLWMAWLWWFLREPNNAGTRNFAQPFAAYLDKGCEAIRDLDAIGWSSSARWSLLLLISLGVQFLVILLRPQWHSSWWRIGAAYALLMVVLGGAVWEGFPPAAARVLLPMTLAFNVVVPRGRWWWPALLVLGNLSTICTVSQWALPGYENYRLEGLASGGPGTSRGAIAVTFDEQWYPSERSTFEYWRWSRGPAGFVIRNRGAAPVEVELDFELRALDERTIRVTQDRVFRWVGRVGRKSVWVRLPGIILASGDTAWSFETDEPPSPPSGDRHRPAAFNLRNLVIRAESPNGRPQTPMPPSR